MGQSFFCQPPIRRRLQLPEDQNFRLKPSPIKPRQPFARGLAIAAPRQTPRCVRLAFVALAHWQRNQKSEARIPVKDAGEEEGGGEGEGQEGEAQARRQLQVSQLRNDLSEMRIGV